MLDTVRALNQVPGTEARLAVMHTVNEYAAEFPDIQPIRVSSKVIPSVSGKWQADTADWDTLIREFKPLVIHSHLFEAEMLRRYQIRPGITYIAHCHDNKHQLKTLSVSEWTSKKNLRKPIKGRFC